MHTFIVEQIGKVYVARTDTGENVGAGSPKQIGDAIAGRLKADAVGNGKGEGR